MNLDIFMNLDIIEFFTSEKPLCMCVLIANISIECVSVFGIMCKCWVKHLHTIQKIFYVYGLYIKIVDVYPQLDQVSQPDDVIYLIGYLFLSYKLSLFGY